MFKRNNLASLFTDANIPKLFVVLGLFLGTMLSLMMPLFNEPDGQYHLAVTGRVINSVIDTSRYGEYNVSSGMYGQEESYLNRTHIEKYYFNKAKFIEFSKVPRTIKFTKTNFVYWGHVVPAIGMLIGKLVYPSMGIMITFARFFSTLFFVVCQYFILKRLKMGRLLFFAVSLSPMVMNQVASLSYDMTTFLIMSYFFMLVINCVVKESVSKRDLVEFGIATILIILATKMNSIIFLLLVPAILYFYNIEIPQLNRVRKKLRFLKILIFKNKKILYISGIISIFVMGAVSYVVTLPMGGLKRVIFRFVRQLIFRDDDRIVDYAYSWFTAPYLGFNHTVMWQYLLWILVIFFILLTERKYRIKTGITYLAILLFVLNIIGVYFVQLSYGGSNAAILGVQGRYFTPYFLVLALTLPNERFSSTLVSNWNWVPVLTSFTIVVTNVLLVFGTLYGLMN